MSLTKVEVMVESYLNGNISDFKQWLKKDATKQDVVDTIGTLINIWWSVRGSASLQSFMDVYFSAVDTVSRYLRG